MVLRNTSQRANIVKASTSRCLLFVPAILCSVYCMSKETFLSPCGSDESRRPTGCSIHSIGVRCGGQPKVAGDIRSPETLCLSRRAKTTSGVQSALGPLALATPGAASNTKVYLLRQGSNSLGRCKNDQSLTNRW